MVLYFDTSAWVPLLIQEEASQDMWPIKSAAESIWSWGWLQVETEAALTRRKATPEGWTNWSRLRREISLVDLQPSESTNLCDFNRVLGLRASNAGHLFVFMRLCAEIPDLQLLTLDVEMARAARSIGLPVHSTSPSRGAAKK